MPGILALAILIGIFACVFALQNTEIISIAFLAWNVEASLALVLLITFGLGAAMGLLACLPTLIKQKLTARIPAEPKIIEPVKTQPPPKEEPRNP